jgi:hypothetical protein
MNYVLQNLIKVIGRRTSINFAMVTVSKIIKKVQQKYDFLNYIDMNDAVYLEKIEELKVKSELDQIDSKKLHDAINDIFETIHESLGSDIGYFFFKEIEEDLQKNADSDFREQIQKLSLSLKFYQTVIQHHKEIKLTQIKNSEVLELVLGALAQTLNKHIPESDVINVLINSIRKQSEKYEFLQFIKISDAPDSDGYYNVDIVPEVDNHISAERGESILSLIIETIKSLDFKKRAVFLNDLKKHFESEELSTLNKVGVNLDQIYEDLIKEEHELVLKKTLEVLVGLIQNSQIGLGAEIINNEIEKIQPNHDVLKYIKVDNTKYSEGIEAFEIMPEIKSAETLEVGKAIKELIKQTYENISAANPSFLDDFKKQIGDEYLSEMEKMGINFHVLSLRIT